jgi:hypothetical protein
MNRVLFHEPENVQDIKIFAGLHDISFRKLGQTRELVLDGYEVHAGSDAELGADGILKVPFEGSGVQVVYERMR